MTVEEAIEELQLHFRTCDKHEQAVEMAISALRAQQKTEEQCDQCDGIFYRQTNSGKIIPCDKICAGKLPQ